jgi:hypothetical protein
MSLSPFTISECPVEPVVPVVPLVTESVVEDADVEVREEEEVEEEGIDEEVEGIEAEVEGIEEISNPPNATCDGVSMVRVDVGGRYGEFVGII